MDYRLVYSRRKSLAIEVNKNLEVIVRAPYFVPKSSIENFVSSRLEWIEKAKQKIIERQKNAPKELSNEEILRLKKLAHEILPERVKVYSQIMSLYPSGVKITSAKTRFGSCSGKNSICFSYLLMQYPSEAIDYVVVHELAHIKHKNHGNRFYDLVKKYLPDYKERQKLLKKPNISH